MYTIIAMKYTKYIKKRIYPKDFCEWMYILHYATILIILHTTLIHQNYLQQSLILFFIKFEH